MELFRGHRDEPSTLCFQVWVAPSSSRLRSATGTATASPATSVAALWWGEAS